jgi:lipid-binding SYLF domain-containing protein
MSVRQGLKLGLLACGVVLLSACSTAPTSEVKKVALDQESQATINRLSAQDPSLRSFLDKAHGYVVFPSIGKGGIGVGGAYGRGIVYERGAIVGYADVTQATIGLQLGGQSYSQIIAFEDKATFDAFKTGNFAFAANASAVAVKTGAAAATNFQNGTAVFTQSEAGLMGEAAVGGQRFTYQAKQ